MKKLIITLEYPPQIGGIATYVEQLANAVGSDSTIVLAPKMGSSVDYDDKKLNVIRKKMFWRFFIWPRWTKLLWQVWRIVKREKIEVIYLHHILPVGYVALLMKKILKVPYLIFSHGTDIEAGTKNWWKKKMFFIVANEAEQIVFNSESLKRRLVQILPDLASKSVVLYPCLDETFYTKPNENFIDDLRAQYALEGKKVILSISRLTDGKGLTHFVRILPKILEKIPNLVWLIIGDGPKKDYLWQEVIKNNLQNIVRFVGEIPHKDLNSFYHVADLFVLLTHPDEGREEGLGLVFLEAQAAGLPVIAGKSGGVEEGVIHLETGIIVNIYQGDKMVINSIVDMLNNKSFADKLAQNALERMKKEFVWEKQLKMIEKWL